MTDRLETGLRGLAGLTLSHHDTAHEDLDRSDALERHLALSCGLVESQLVSEFVLADGVGVVDLVAENEEGDLGELLHGEEGVELGLGLGETLVILSVNEENDTAHFGEVVLPETTGCTRSALSEVDSPGGRCMVRVDWG